MSKSMREQISLGDIIEVVSKNCKTNFSSCDVYPPPNVGTLSVVVADDSSLTFTTQNWGVAGAKLIYSVCIYLTPNECNDICESTTAVFTCNQNNILKLGYFNSGGSYTVMMRVKYNDIAKVSMYSDIKTTITVVSSKDDSATALEVVKKVKSLGSLTDFLDYYYQMRVAIGMLNGVNDTRAARVIYNKSAACTRSYCSYGGTCRLVNDMKLCNCTDKYAGFRCQIDLKNLKLIQTANEQAMADLMLFNITDESSSNTILDIISTITGIYSGLTNDLCLNICSKLNESIFASQSENTFTRTKKIAGDITTATLLQQLQPYTAIASRSLSDSNSTAITLGTMTTALLIFDKYVYQRAINLTIGSVEKLEINGVVGGIFRKFYAFNRANVSIDFDGVVLAVELPYLMKDIIKVPNIYEIDSSILHVSSFSEGPESDFYFREYNMSFNYNMTQNNSKVYSHKCACYDPSISKVSTSYCKKAIIEKGVVTCRCTEAPLMCFVMKQVAVNPGISIAVPVLCGGALLAVIIVLIVMRKRICKGKSESTPNPITKGEEDDMPEPEPEQEIEPTPDQEQDQDKEKITQK